MHFDDHEVIVVQLAGRKTWRIAKNNTLTNPTSNSGPSLVEEVARYASKSSVKRMPAGSTVEMAPGSALFLPRGYWHTTDAREPSISLTFGFRTPCWAELLRDFLGQRLVEHADWREPAWNVWEKHSVNADAERRWRELCEGLVPLLSSITVSDLIAAHGADDLTS
jgi:ribosomal protein L16 Arg81 hydroxylase